MDLFCRPIEIWAGFSCSDRCKPSGGVSSQLSPFSPCLLFSLHVYEEMMYECFLQRRLFYCNSFLFLFKGRSVRVTVTSFPNNLLNECIKDSRSGTVMARNAWLKFKSILLTCKLLLTCFETLLYPRNLLLKEKNNDRIFRVEFENWKFVEVQPYPGPCWENQTRFAVAVCLHTLNLYLF